MMVLSIKIVAAGEGRECGHCDEDVIGGCSGRF